MVLVLKTKTFSFFSLHLLFLKALILTDIQDF